MKSYKEKLTKVLDEIFCDVCGGNCSFTELCKEHEYATLEASWGYFSNKDGFEYEVHLCEHCFDIVLGNLKHQRQKNLAPFKYPHENDPLNGKSYIPSI